MRVLDLRQLEYFRRVAERGNISLAAAELKLTQPSLTKSIKLLEKELGVRLFDRLARGVELTDYGRALLRHAEAIRVQAADASSELTALKSGSFGAVSVGAGPAWLRRHLPRAVAETVTRHPGVRVRVGGGFDEELFRALRRGEYDFVVAELPQAEDRRGLEVRPLTSDELGVCCREGHPLARRRRVSARDVLPFPWVLLPRTTRAQRRLTALFAAQDLTPPQNVVETSSHAFLLNMLRTSDALSFTTAHTVDTEEGAGLVMLNVPPLTVRREAGIVLRRGAFLSPAARHLIDRLTAICRADPRN
ncbi:MAG TPA: LysR family transcriptional regulator [Reyranella sp.]|jgi:LysR family transcriptional regulator of gallate degradation|nr:LysR family transcriptional regulator [Reyranella sp.]